MGGWVAAWLTVLVALLVFLGRTEGAGIEATLIAVDLSGFMANEDYPPSRLQCQYECVNLITTVKTQNPESTVGLMTMSCGEEDCPTVVVTPTMSSDSLSDQSEILTRLHKLNQRPKHPVQFERAMEVGFMSLKNRPNKNQSPRIVAFVGSPLRIESPDELVKFGKTLRKHNMAVDIISFGESTALNTPILQKFVDSVDREGNSHLLSLPVETCPPGGLADALFFSPLLADFSQQFSQGGAKPEGAPGSAPAAPAPAPPDFSEYGGVNPELDPELAFAIKASKEEDKDRRAKERERDMAALRQLEEGGTANQGGDGTGMRQPGGVGGGAAAGDEEDAELKAALRASLEGGGGGGAVSGGGAGDGGGMEDEDEESLLQRAVELSLKEENGSGGKEEDAMQDQNPGGDQ